MGKNDLPTWVFEANHPLKLYFDGGAVANHPSIHISLNKNSYQLKQS